ncbi:hypothetical protein BGX26_004541 [Mortierella sp. AD094]|nr:hypothetical protein BGX26_004541 [Mortierella sp. AD094]
MTFSIPQPIPSRSSHPVHAHQRPPIRRSHSSNSAAVAAAAFNNNTNSNSNKFGLSQLLATSDHHHQHRHLLNIDDDFNLASEDDERQQRRPDSDVTDDDDDNDDNDDILQVRIDSGHYSDLEMVSKSRGIPIGKPTFRYSQKGNGHLFGTAVGGSFDSKQTEDMQNAPRFRYSHSHSNSDSHNSVNLIADNLKAAHSEKTAAGNLLENTQNDPSVQLAHFQYEQLQQPRLGQENCYSNSSLASPSNISSCTPCAPTTSSPSLPSSSPSPAVSITIPQRAQRRSEVLRSENISFQGGFEHNTNPTQVNNNTSVISAKSNIDTDSGNNSDNKAHHHTHSHAHPNISIDTSKARLQNTSVSAAKPIPKSAAASTAPVKKTISTNNLQRPPRSDAQSLFGSKKDDNKSVSSPSLSMSTPTSNGSTRPLMMASQSRLSSALPPTPSFLQQPANVQDSQSSVLLPSLSPSSPRSNSALVNSLEQLSVSWKTPELTPSFPINRLHRSRTISSGTRPIINCSLSSNGTTSSTNSVSQYQSSFMSPNTMVTSSSYSSLPYSPAVAFLSNFVDVTAPRMAPDEEGEQVGDFIMGKMIGHGGFSIVREAFAIHLDGLVAQVAVKIVKTQTGATDNDRVQRMLDKEIAIWSRLSHPNVLPFVAVEKLPTDTFVFCELCTGGNLLDYLTRQEAPSYMSSGSGTTVGLEECQARAIFKQIAEAVRYLHEEKRIVHRDIKLENILQHEDGTWKICDFGLAEYQNDEAASYFGSPLSPTIYNPRASANANASHESPSSVRSQGSLADNDGCFDTVVEEEEEEVVGGSLAYCSPEQLRSQKPLRCPSSDVWSLGVVLYALLTGRLPFQDEYEPRLQFQILNGRYEDPTQCSAEARDLLKNMFRSKPEDRWRIGQVIDSPWCMGTTLESFGDFSSIDNNNNSSHAKMNNFFSTFRF